MKHLLISLTLIISASILVAQPGMYGQVDPETAAQRQTERMTEHLSLTDEQIPQIYAINLKYAQLRAEIREQADTREAAMMQMKSLQGDMLEEFRQVLDSEQMATVEEHHAQRQQQGRKRKRRGQPDKPKDPQDPR